MLGQPPVEPQLTIRLTPDCDICCRLQRPQLLGESARHVGDLGAVVQRALSFDGHEVALLTSDRLVEHAPGHDEAVSACSSR